MNADACECCGTRCGDGIGHPSAQEHARIMRECRIPATVSYCALKGALDFTFRAAGANEDSGVVSWFWRLSDGRSGLDTWLHRELCSFADAVQAAAGLAGMRIVDPYADGVSR